MVEKGLTPFADPSEVGGYDSGQTDIRQLSEAMVPKDGEFSEVWMKSRLTAEAQPAFDHIMSAAIMEQRIKLPFQTKGMDAAESLAVAHSMTTYALEGKSQDTLSQIFGGVASFMRRPFSAMRGRRSNYEDQEFQR